MLLGGCATHRMEVVFPGVAIELGENEGLLILHVDTDVELERVSLRSDVVATDLPAGDHLWIVRMPAKRFSWQRISFGKEAGRRRDVLVTRLEGVDDDEFEFDVLAGHINYPGTLIVRSTSVPGWQRGWVWIRNRNHSAMAIRALLKSHPRLLESMPIRYGGTSGDEFLQFYTEERNRVDSQRVGESD